MELHEKLVPLKQKIEQTLTSVAHIELKKEEASVYESKVGGNPYVPLTSSIPTGSDGTPLRLLAQINFSLMSDRPENFPQQGMLQFFIHPSDEIFGADHINGTKQDNFRIVYHEEILYPEEIQHDFPAVENSEDFVLMNFEQSYPMQFTVTKDPVSTMDFRFYEALGIDFDEYDIIDTYYETVTREGHKLGGYADFVQTDPRAEGEFMDKTEVLFQLDTDEDFGIMWHDVGVGVFLISKEDLLNLKFDDVVFYWDSH